MRDSLLIHQGTQHFSSGKRNVFWIPGCISSLAYVDSRAAFPTQVGVLFTPVGTIWMVSHKRHHFLFYALQSWAVVRQLSTTLCREPSPSSGGCFNWYQLVVLVSSKMLIPVYLLQTLLPLPFSPELWHSNLWYHTKMEALSSSLSVLSFASCKQSIT